MQEFQFTESVLLTIIGWLVISLAAGDMVSTARLSLACHNSGSFADFRKASAFRVTRALVRIGCKSRLNIFVPALQFLRWTGILVLGFAFLYLAAEGQLRGKNGLGTGGHLGSAILLSLSVGSLIAANTALLPGSAALFVANLQFYLFFGFYLFGFLYAVVLRRKSKKLRARLYHLQDRHISPEELAGKLLHDYHPNDLLLVLQDWERWAEDLRCAMQAHPQLAYNTVRRGEISWPASLALMLDASAALAAQGDTAIGRQAGWTYRAGRRLVLDAAETILFIKGSPPGDENGPSGLFTKLT